MKKKKEVTNIKIEKGIKIPSKKGKPNKYPLHKLKVGESFCLPYDRTVQISLYGSIANYRYWYPKKKFSVTACKFDNYIRCWRKK